MGIGTNNVIKVKTDEMWVVVVVVVVVAVLW